MKCEYFSINYFDDPILEDCKNEDARYYTCDHIHGIVCEKHRCRCFKNMKPLTDEQIKEILEKRAQQK